MREGSDLSKRDPPIVGTPGGIVRKLWWLFHRTVRKIGLYEGGERGAKAGISCKVRRWTCRVSGIEHHGVRWRQGGT
jgi:hypothetical protein